MSSSERWTDMALDQLEHRVDDAENELIPLRAIPELVAQHERRLDRTREDELRRIGALYGRLERLEERINARVEAAAAGAAERVEESLSVNWRTVLTTLLAAGTGIGAPIAAALILAPS